MDEPQNCITEESENYEHKRHCDNGDSEAEEMVIAVMYCFLIFRLGDF